MQLKAQGNEAFPPLLGLQIEVEKAAFNADPAPKIEQLHVRHVAQPLASSIQ